MATVSFTSALQRHLGCPQTAATRGATVREALDEVFEEHPALRSYIVDEQGALRQHMAIFVDGQAIRDRRRLEDAIGPEAEVHVIQALSGG